MNIMQLPMHPTKLLLELTSCINPIAEPESFRTENFKNYKTTQEISLRYSVNCYGKCKWKYKNDQSNICCLVSSQALWNQFDKNSTVV